MNELSAKAAKGNMEEWNTLHQQYNRENRTKMKD